MIWLASRPRTFSRAPCRLTINGWFAGTASKKESRICAEHSRHFRLQLQQRQKDRPVVYLMIVTKKSPAEKPKWAAVVTFWILGGDAQRLGHLLTRSHAALSPFQTTVAKAWPGLTAPNGLTTEIRYIIPSGQLRHFVLTIAQAISRRKASIFHEIRQNTRISNELNVLVKSHHVSQDQRWGLTKNEDTKQSALRGVVLSPSYSITGCRGARLES